MKYIATTLTITAAVIFAVSAISSLSSVDIFGTEPARWSTISVSMLLIAGAYIACRFVGILGEPSTGGQPSDLMSRLAQLSFLLLVVGFFIAMITVFISGSVLGKPFGIWISGSLNLFLITVVSCFSGNE